MPNQYTPLAPRVPLVCAGCGSAFERTERHARRTLKGRHYCTPACMLKGEPFTVSPDGLSATIPVRGYDGGLLAFITVDVTDAPFASQWRWHLDHGYAARWDKTEGDARSIFLHRVLLDLPRGKNPQVDHINRVRSDCRRSNLRIATHAENMQNKPNYAGSASRYRGVSPAPNGTWRARMTVRGTTYALGHFRTEIEAAEAARAARARLMPYATD